MALDDRDWYRNQVKENPNRYGLPKNYIYNPKEFRRFWNQPLEKKKPNQIWIWLFWIALLLGSFLAFQYFMPKKKAAQPPSIQLQQDKPKVQI